MSKRPVTPPKYEHLHDLLGKFGLSVITPDQFWGQMKRFGYGQDDIDWYLAEDRRREDEREKDRAERSRAESAAGNELAAARARQARREGQGADRQDGQGHRQEAAQRSRTLIWTITALQIEFVDGLAMKHTKARVSGGSRTANGQPTDFERRFRDTRNGYRAEAAVRLWAGRDVQWTLISDATGHPDFAGFIDVKARQKTHHKLPINNECKPERAYLLVCGARHPEYRIVGWCWGHEAMVDDYWSDPGTGRPAWWVGEEDAILKSPDELLAEIRKRS